jgi:hypothetical protein
MPSTERVTPSSEQMEVIADDSESVAEHAEVMRDSIIEVALGAGQVLSRRPAGVSRDRADIRIGRGDRAFRRGDGPIRLADRSRVPGEDHRPILTRQLPGALSERESRHDTATTQHDCWQLLDTGKRGRLRTLPRSPQSPHARAARTVDDRDEGRRRRGAAAHARGAASRRA